MMTFEEIKNFVQNVAGVYLLWILVHYISAHLYVHWCVPATILGFIASPFIAPAPHCQALRWGLYNGGNSIIAMWLILGAWLSKFIIPMKISSA